MSESLQENQLEAADMVKKFESFRSKPYQDSVGIWTIGYGSTRDVNENPVTEHTPEISENDAVSLLMRDMQTAFRDIGQEVKVPLTAKEYDAISSLIYNIGAGAFNGSTLLKYLNNKDYKNAAIQFLQWDHAAGVVIAGLMVRRWAEMTTFQSGEV
jgi:lysozyme